MTEVPQHVRDTAKGAFRLHRPGRVLLERVDDEQAGGSQPSSAVFAADGVCVRLDVERSEDRARLTIHLQPDDDAVVELQHPEPDLSLVTRGRSPLHLDAAPGRSGLVRLLITQDGAATPQRRWQTAWTSL